MTERSIIARLKRVRAWNLKRQMSSNKVALDSALNGAIASCNQRTVDAVRIALRRHGCREWADDMVQISAALRQCKQVTTQ